MNHNEIIVSLLDNFKIQNSLLFEQLILLKKSENINSDILQNTSLVDSKLILFNCILNNFIEKINTSNILLFCIFILQLFLLFK